MPLLLIGLAGIAIVALLATKQKEMSEDEKQEALNDARAAERDAKDTADSQNIPVTPKQAEELAKGAAGLLTLAGAGALTVIGVAALAITVAAGITGFIYGIIKFVNENRRREEVKGGAAREEYRTQYETLKSKLREQFKLSKPELNDAQVERISAHIANGYCRHRDWLLYRGAIGDEISGLPGKFKNAQWGFELGRFIGEINVSGDYINGPAIIDTYDDVWLRRNVPAHRLAYETVKIPLPPPPLGPGGTKISQKLYDMDALVYHRMGKILANAQAYVDWMNSPIGLGQSTNSHFDYGKSRGFFDGTRLPGTMAHLSFEGGVFSYQKSEGGLRQLTVIHTPAVDEALPDPIANPPPPITPEVYLQSNTPTVTVPQTNLQTLSTTDKAKLAGF